MATPATKASGIGHRNRECFAGLARGAADFLAIGRGDGLHRLPVRRAPSRHRQLKLAAVDVGNHSQFVDVRLSDRLEPHGLPDSGRRRVKNSVGLERLLAVRLAPFDRVPRAHDQFLRPGRLERVGDVASEAVVTAGMGADFDAIDENMASPNSPRRNSTARFGPAQAAGISICRRYQMRLLSSTGLLTWERTDCGGKGTRIFPSKCAGISAALAVIA